MVKYRKRPIVVDAIQLNWKNWGEICELLNGIINEDNPGRMSDYFSDTCDEIPPYVEITIPTLEGNHIVKHGDWIIKGIAGEFYSCKPYIFKNLYDIVED